MLSPWTRPCELDAYFEVFPSDLIVECWTLPQPFGYKQYSYCQVQGKYNPRAFPSHSFIRYWVPPCQPALAHLHRIGMNLMRRQRISKPMTTGAPLSLSRLSRMQAAIQTIRENAILTGSAHSPPSLHPFPNSTSAYRRLLPETFTLNYQTLENGNAPGLHKGINDHDQNTPMTRQAIGNMPLQWFAPMIPTIDWNCSAI